MSKEKPIVMVIEDETLLLQAVVKKMKILGIEAVPCTNGKQAMDYLNSLPQLPDAIWLDYYLKDMNGLEFMQQVKKNENWSHIPVIVVSNSATEEKVHHMLALGVKKYLLKAQYRLDEIIALVKTFIKEGE